MKKAVRNGLVAFLALDILLLCTSPAGALVRTYVAGRSYCPAWDTLTAARTVNLGANITIAMNIRPK